MKKLQKGVALTLAAVLSASALAAASFTTMAQDAYTLGDVDMDGVITGHDSAMVSRYLNVDTDLLDATQLTLADVNEDGVVSPLDSYYLLAAYATKQVCDTFYGEGRYDLYAAGISYSNGEEVAASQEESIVEEYLAD